VADDVCPRITSYLAALSKSKTQFRDVFHPESERRKQNCLEAQQPSRRARQLPLRAPRQSSSLHTTRNRTASIIKDKTTFLPPFSDPVFSVCQKPMSPMPKPCIFHLKIIPFSCQPSRRTRDFASLSLDKTSQTTSARHSRQSCQSAKVRVRTWKEHLDKHS